jgi:Fic family protein
MNYVKLTKKKQELDKFRPLPAALLKNLEDWFTVELTYTSNAIEGNTLTRRETAVVIEKGITIGGKSIKEHLEATNHAQALELIYSLIKKKPSKLLLSDVLDIHRIILKSIDDENAGHFRNVPVRISGSTVVMPNYRKVPELMAEFHTWLITHHDTHPVAFAGEAHYRLVTIHPFVDGNGRTARLLMNLILMMHGYPPAIIRKRDRLVYIGALEKAQLGGSKHDYENIIGNAADRSLNIYLKAAAGESSFSGLDTDNLLKIGNLAKAVNVTVPTIRHWTKEGLLEIVAYTESGYQLYAPDMVDRCKQIKELQKKRLSLSEIKHQIQNAG